MNAEEIRRQAIERIARAEYAATNRDYFDPEWERLPSEVRDLYRRGARRAVDALGDLLPTGIEWGAALVPDENPIRTVVFGFTGDEDAARNWDHPIRRYTTDWSEVRG
ncbi:hypothetical protein [Nocardia africana]